MPSTFSTRPYQTAIIIGAGFSGLAMACQLQRKLKCTDYTIYDRLGGHGGTWWANQYPGCAVDIPAAFYSLSFAPNYSFSALFPGQQEILAYFNAVAKRYDVPRHIVYKTEWESARWQESDKMWLVTLRNIDTGEVFFQKCKVLISAVGGLVNPNRLDVNGINSFEGEIMHTARWAKDTSVENKHVIVIGNGCSAAQVIPAIVEKAKSVTQIIRTPQYYMPAQNWRVWFIWKFMFRFVPGVLFCFRIFIFLYLETVFAHFDLTKKGDKSRQHMAENSKAHIRRHAPEKYWALLMPSYEVGCKRRIFDDKYISSLQRDNVHLSDDPIVSIQARSISTKSGRQYPADLIVLANGFSLTQYNVPLYGRNGRSREQHWEKFGCIEAYKSIAMEGFPNFFYILGPNSGRGHTSVLYSIENYVDLVIQMITPILRELAHAVEVKATSEERYNKDLHTAMNKTVFTNTCTSYFIDSNTGKNWFIYPWSSFKLWSSTRWESAGNWTWDFTKAS